MWFPRSTNAILISPIIVDDRQGGAAAGAMGDGIIVFA